EILRPPRRAQNDKRKSKGGNNVMHIRGFEAEDFEAVWRLDQSCYPPGIAYSHYALGEFLSLPGARAWVAKDEAQLIGFIIARRAAKRLGHVITLDVREDRRRQGIGSALLSTAEVWLRGEDVTRVRLETAVDNPAAVAFWEKTGFATVDVLAGYYLGRVDAYRMEKELKA
ncbi:MAG: GNAT family N-acetyltransferase, partial [Acidobacteria bacterium]|nr:GNAT family N-acetyltransferase [Acidobacteriota bacterium]